MVMRSEKIKEKYMMKDVLKNFFRKLAVWRLAVSLQINFPTDSFQGF